MIVDPSTFVGEQGQPDREAMLLIRRTVARLRNATGYKDTTIGAVAEALGWTARQVVLGIDQHCFWICYDRREGVSPAWWPVYEDGE